MAMFKKLENVTGLQMIFELTECVWNQVPNQIVHTCVNMLEQWSMNKGRRMYWVKYSNWIHVLLVWLEQLSLSPCLTSGGPVNEDESRDHLKCGFNSVWGSKAQVHGIKNPGAAD